MVRTVLECQVSNMVHSDICPRLTTQAAGGCLTLEDLAGHLSEFVTPLSIGYKGLRLWEPPPNGSGLNALLAAGILDGVSTADLGAHGSARQLHMQIEAVRLAFADGRALIADGNTPEEVARLLSPGYLASRRRVIDPSKATADVAQGSPEHGSDTVSLQVVDGQGNAVSFVNSVYSEFGCGLVARGTGFALQDRGANFSLKKGRLRRGPPVIIPLHSLLYGSSL